MNNVYGGSSRVGQGWGFSSLIALNGLNGLPDDKTAKLR